jgi:flagellar protein FliS
MSPQNYYKAYRNASETVGKSRQIVMLYEGALKFVKQARLASQDRRLDERFTLLDKALRIVHGMQDSLDFEQGGKVAELLRDFYSDVSHDLYLAAQHDRADAYERAIDKMEMMLKQWQRIDGEYVEPQAAVPPPSIPQDGSAASIGFSA